MSGLYQRCLAPRERAASSGLDKTDHYRVVAQHQHDKPIGKYSEMGITLFLACRAPEPEPFLSRSPLLAPPDRSPAASAWPPRPPVHPVLPPRLGVPGRHMPEPPLIS